MAVVMEGGGWRRAHALVEAGSGGRDVLLQSSNSSNKSSDDSSKPSTSSTSGASTVVALGGGGGGGGVQQPSKKRGWGDVELQKALQLMLRQVPAAAAAAERETVDFLGVSGAPGWARAGEFLELDPANFPLPLGWEKCLDLRSGAVYFLNRATGEKTLADPRHPQLAVSSGLGLGLGLGSSSAAAAVPAGTGGGTTTSYSRDGAEADRNSDSPSPRWDRAIDSPSVFRTSSLTDEPAAPRPWALEHWAAAARGFSERTTTNPAPASAATAGAASSDLRTVRWMHQQQQQPAVEEDSWRTQGLNSSCEVVDDGMVVAGGGSDLELKLSSCSSGLALAAEVRDDGRSVCTMEKVRQALLRSKAATPNAAASAPRWSGPARLQAAHSPAAQQLFSNLRSSPASPCHSSSSASSSTPPSIHDLPVAVAASPPERCFRSCSPKVQPPLPSSSCYRAVSSPNCVSRTSSSNLSSPSHPASSGGAGLHLPHAPGSSFLSPNLASLKLASPSLSELERGASSQVLTLGGGGGAPSSSPANCGSGGMVVDCSNRDNSGNIGGGSMTLACCKNCLMYTLLAREDPRCPRCYKYVDVGFAPSGPHPQALQLLPPPLKKAKVELDL